MRKGEDIRVRRGGGKLQEDGSEKESGKEGKRR